MSGSIIISLVLSLPTVGPVLLKALIAQDMYLAGTIVLLLGVLTVVGTFISDLVLMWIDPRIRHQVDHDMRPLATAFGRLFRRGRRKRRAPTPRIASRLRPSCS